MIEITPTIQLDESELHYDFIRASGPGGQNVNKVSTAVQLRFDVRNSPNLPDDVKERLLQLAGNRVTADGILIIEARSYRTQDQNRYDAFDRLRTLITEAARRPKPRRPTRPTVTASARRTAQKSHRADLKRLRNADPEEDFEDWYFDER
ncbi:MAG: aminoacyl-tRNA hydrolase [Anaerolinea sp.]|nr:aminoacyl-tRNA hydrolase [Anaerolinea sp.]